MRQLIEWSSGAAEANAAEAAPLKPTDLVPKLQALGKKLYRVIVSEDNADQYRADVAALIELSGRRAIAQEDVDSQYRGLYDRLVKAAAWQESCWRQFRLQGNKVVYLESSTADVGLMQVNKYVWRGFYSVPRLEWDVLYNAGAGTQILGNLFEGIQSKRGAMTPGKPNELARSTYAAYNGGPSAYRRWRRGESNHDRLVDEAFWSKYQAVSRGQKIDILTCAAEWDKAHGH
jgi:hypothetical protein